MLGACTTSVTGWPGIAVPPGSAHLKTIIYSIVKRKEKLLSDNSSEIQFGTKCSKNDVVKKSDRAVNFENKFQNVGFLNVTRLHCDESSKSN